MKKLLLLLLLSVPAFTILSTASYAQTCNANQYNMLDWMTLDNPSNEHVTGPQNLPLYTQLPANNLFWWIKGNHNGQGYPWDVQYYDSNYIYQWITETQSSWTDPTNFKAFDNKAALKWTPICLPQLAQGQRLSSITVPNANTAYHVYGPSCAKGTTTYYLGNTVNEVWNFGDLDIGGTIGKHPDLQLAYRYTCDTNYNNCTYKEVYDFMQNYGLVQWTYYKLIGGSYVQQNQTTFNSTASGGTTPYFPCPMP